MLEARDDGRLIDAARTGRRTDLDGVVLGASLDLAVERYESLLGDLLGLRTPDIELAARTELLASLSVDAADDDVCVRMIGVVMIDRGPLKLPTKVPLDTRHEALDVVGEIEFVGIFRRDDESELVLLVVISRGVAR